MHKFRYRAPRFQVDFPVCLTIEARTFIGRCHEISREGMRIELAEPLPSHASGAISFELNHRSLQLNVSVIRTGATQDGLKFCFESDKQRALVADLIGSLASAPASRRPVLVR